MDGRLPAFPRRARRHPAARLIFATSQAAAEDSGFLAKAWADMAKAGVERIQSADIAVS